MSCNSWKEYKLEEICVDITDGSHSSPNSVEYGYPMASVKDMEYHKINLESCRKISEEDYNKLVKGKCKPNVGDVLIAKDGSYLKHVNVVKEEIDLVILSSIAILRPNLEKINPDFLKYYLLNPQVKQTLEQGYVSGSAIRRIVLKDFKRFIVEIPSLKEQKKIVDVLTSLDQKIELNNEMNKTLEEMAQALFKRWFVDFEFPNEEGKPYKSSGGEMVESELGMIPNGWETTLISDVIEVKDGTHASPKPKEEGYALITSKHISGDKIDFKSAKLISKEDYDEINKRSKVDTGDILISMIGTVGLIHLIQEQDIDFAIKNVGLFKSSQKKEISEYLYLLLKSRCMQNYIEERLAGTTQKYISLGELRKIKFILPNEKVIDRFNSIIKNIFDKKRKNIEQTDGLIELRDSLLPKLMSGEIRVEDIKASL